VILNVGKYAPNFKMGFTVMSVLSVCQFGMIFVIKYFVDRDRKRAAAVKSVISERESEDYSLPAANEK
jgi:ACS family pantothenate transporter-like MFS transporter